MTYITSPRAVRAGAAMFVCSSVTTLLGACAERPPEPSTIPSPGVVIEHEPRMATAQDPPPRTELQQISATFLSPRGNPACSPCSPGDRPSEYVFDDETPASIKMTLRVRARGIERLEDARTDFQFVIPDILGTRTTWHPEYTNGVPLARRGELVAEVSLVGMPPQNSAFGRKTVQLMYQGRPIASQAFEIFYQATARNNGHRNDTGESVPNWFHYYKQSAGGGNYQYGCDGRSGRSVTVGPDEKSISICGEAYSGHNRFMTEPRSDGQLRVVRSSRDATYYSGFIGALRHEQYHASHWARENDPADTDHDGISDEEERTVTKTNPANKYSARDSSPEAKRLWKEEDAQRMTDAEIYANGPVEEDAVKTADTSGDWAAPGTNYGTAVGNRTPR